MRLIRLFDPQDLSGKTSISLNEAPSHHLLKVLRAKTGVEVEIFDGKGNWVRGKLSSNSSKKVAVIDIDSTGEKNNESPVTTTMYLALSKGDRFEYALQKATELGVSHIIPIISERSEFKLSGDRLDKKVNSWQQICIAACEQCYRYRVPTVSAPQRLEQAIANDIAQEKWVLHHRSTTQLDPSLSPSSISFIIGPEGGLSEGEIELAHSLGFKSKLFGPRVLRTETAPVVALTLIQSLYGDF